MHTFIVVFTIKFTVSLDKSKFPIAVKISAGISPEKVKPIDSSLASAMSNLGSGRKKHKI